MNESELHLAETLVEKGRLRPEELQTCLESKRDGEGFVDTLLRQGTIRTEELEGILEGLPAVPRAEGDFDTMVRAVKRIGRYVVMNELGRGGMGRVYLAYDTHLKRSVALKVMKIGDADDVSRYQRETEIAASLLHPNIAALYDAHAIDGTFVIAMQYIDGRSLDKLALETRPALEAIAQAARAVQSAHDRGIIHRDLKPENLMLTKDGRVFVLDFGVARSFDKAAALTQTGTLVGTPVYMSPDQAAGRKLGPRTDVYSLGATLYALLARQPPFHGESVLDVVQKVITQEPPPLRKVNPRIHRDIETIVLKAMRKEREQRYQTALEFAEDIERFLSGEPIDARPISVFGRSVRYLRKRPWAINLLMIAIVGFGVAGGLTWYEARRKDRDEAERRRILQEQREKEEVLARANKLAAEAAARIEEWDRLLDAEPMDLTAHRVKLARAIELCDEALKRSGGDLGSAFHQKARALARLGQGAEAEKVISAAIAARPDARFYLERARIRLLRLTRELTGVPQFFTFQFAISSTLKPWKGVIERYRRPILEDLRVARRQGARLRFEQVYMEIAEHAFSDRFDRAKALARRELPEVLPWERAELYRLLAWLTFLEYLESLPRLDLSRQDPAQAPLLRDAQDHVSEALRHRRSDADLYLLRAALAIWRINQAWTALRAQSRPPSDEAVKRWMRRLREEGVRIERAQRAAAATARKDIETAAGIRPDDPETALLHANLQITDIPHSVWIELTAAVDEDDPREILEMISIRKRIRAKEIVAGSIDPAIAIVRNLLRRFPDTPMAWVQLAVFEYQRIMTTLWNVYVSGDSVTMTRVLEAATRAFQYPLDPNVGAFLRFLRAFVYSFRYQVSGGKDAAAREAVRREIREVEKIFPAMAKEYKKHLPQIFGKTE